jgi:hypothetical protein
METDEENNTIVMILKNKILLVEAGFGILTVMIRDRFGFFSR